MQPNNWIDKLMLFLCKLLNWSDMPSIDSETIVIPPPIAPKPPFSAPQTPETAISTPKATIANFCLAIEAYEGGPGDRNYRNKNPGNCRYSSVGYLPKYEPVGKDKDGFAIFKDMATGMNYLQNMIKAKVHLHPNQTILEFMSVYAPITDGNNPKLYSVFIAKRLGVDNSFLMKNLV